VCSSDLPQSPIPNPQSPLKNSSPKI